MTEDFTWEYRDLVEIKKRNRFIKRWYRPTMKNLIREASVARWNRAKELNVTQNNKKIVTSYKLYDFFADQVQTKEENLPDRYGKITGDSYDIKEMTPEMI